MSSQTVFDNTLMQHHVALLLGSMWRISYTCTSWSVQPAGTELELEFQGIKKKFTMLQACCVEACCLYTSFDRAVFTGCAIAISFWEALGAIPGALVVVKLSLVRHFPSTPIPKLWPMWAVNAEMRWPRFSWCCWVL